MKRYEDAIALQKKVFKPSSKTARELNKTIAKRIWRKSLPRYIPGIAMAGGSAMILNKDNSDPDPKKIAGLFTATATTLIGAHYLAYKDFTKEQRVLTLPIFKDQYVDFKYHDLRQILQQYVSYYIPPTLDIFTPTYLPTQHYATLFLNRIQVPYTSHTQSYVLQFLGNHTKEAKEKRSEIKKRLGIKSQVRLHQDTPRTRYLAYKEYGKFLGGLPLNNETTNVQEIIQEYNDLFFSDFLTKLEYEVIKNEINKELQKM